MSHQRSKGKGKVKSARHQTDHDHSGWSDWAWSPEDQKYYRQRLNAAGKSEYEWKEAVYSDPGVPRTYDVIVPQQIPEVSSHSTEDFPTAENPYYTHTKPGSIEELTDAFGQATIGNSEPSTIKTSNEHTKSESFDSRYKVHRSSDFRFGKIFKTIWSEPSGETGGTQWSVRGNQSSKVRRFLVVNPMKGHSLCLAIMSYSGRGTTKPGVKAEDHAIIFTTNKPVCLSGENGMILAPLKVEPDTSQFGTLDSASRLNYAKIYTVEHNVKLDYNRIHPPLGSTNKAYYDSGNGDNSTGGGYHSSRNGGGGYYTSGSGGNSSNAASYDTAASGNSSYPYYGDQFAGYTQSTFESPYPHFNQQLYHGYPNSSEMPISYTPMNQPQGVAYANDYEDPTQVAYQGSQQAAELSNTSYQNSSSAAAEEYGTPTYHYGTN